MKKVTKKATRDFLKFKLSTNKHWAVNALLKIYEYQTVAEAEGEYTYDRNDVGFTGVDGKILTSFAKFYLRKKYLSQAQMKILLKKMPKYWKQILSNSDLNKLNPMVEEYLLTV